MKRFLLKITIYFIFLLFIGSAFAGLASHFLEKSFFYKPNFIANYLPKKSKYDYIIAGSSRGLTTIDTEKVDRALELKGLNISMDDTGLPSQVLMIKHFYESGHSANFCVITLDAGHIESSLEILNDNDYRFVAYSDRDYVWNYYRKHEKGIIRPLTLSRHLPIVAFSYYNLELFWTGIFSAIRPTYTNRFDLRGNYFYPDSAQNFEEDLEQTTETKSLINPLIKELEEYLKIKDTKLIVYIAPYWGRKIDLIKNKSYYTINHSAALESKELFYDRDHVTSPGREKATELFIQEFKKVKDLDVF